MSLLLFLFAVLNSSSNALVARPNISTENRLVELIGRGVPDSCPEVGQCRTLTEIVLSCLATVFACTWVSIHPNLPGPEDSGWLRFRRQTLTMVCAVIAPEFMAVWAMRQRLGARKIADKFNGTFYPGVRVLKKPWYRIISDWFRPKDRKGSKLWTLKHGFFVQMGGFMLCEGGEPKYVLTFNTLMQKIEAGEVDVPALSGRELDDKNKGDMLAKLFVILQMAWFTFQCIARWATQLLVTELEVATLAFAAMNVLMYTLWWHKPQNVMVFYPVPLKSAPLASQVDNDNSGAEETASLASVVRTTFQIVVETISFILFGPLIILFSLIKALFKMNGFDNGGNIRDGSMRVPTFYAEPDSGLSIHRWGLIGTLFGGIHMLAWSTPPMTALWRIGVLTITILPVSLIILIWIPVAGVVEPETGILFSALLVFPLGFVIYIVARIMIIVLAFLTLRELPEAGYRDIDWASFIPHF